MTLAQVMEALRPGEARTLVEHAWRPVRLAEMTARTGARSRTGSKSCGYVPVRNSSAESGLWVIAGKRQVVYGRKDVAPAERLAAAEALKAAEDLKAAELKKKFGTGIAELRK